jgi:hypothetical protein
MTRRRLARRGWLLPLVVLAALPAAADEPTTAEDLKPLLERIAAGRDTTGDAEQELRDRLLDPLMTALGDLQDRPGREQRRLDAALGRLVGALRYRVARLNLPPADLKLLDQMHAGNPTLVENAFHDSEEQRLAALRRVPLQPDSGAGVLLALKVEDASMAVRDTALELAARLGDDVVARNLARQTRRWLDLLKGDAFSPEEKVAYSILFAEWIRQGAQIVASAGNPELAPPFIEALTFFTAADRPARLIQFDQFAGDLALALGELGNPAAQPVLEELVTYDRPYRQRAVPDFGLVSQTVGDAAMLAILRLHDAEPEDFRFMRVQAGENFWGFDSQATRAAALIQFREWLTTHSPPTPQDSLEEIDDGR